MAKQSFVTGQVLTAQQVNDLQTNDFNQTVSAKTASYTLVAADKGTRITMSSTSATTITVNTGLFAAGDTLFIQNLNTGVATITAGTATVDTSASLALAQHEGGTLYFTSAGVSTFFKAAGATANTFVGAQIYDSNATTSISNNTSTAITFNSEVLDTNTFHSTSSNTSRMTIPAGKAGKYLVVGSVIFQNAANGTRRFDIFKNGSSYARTQNFGDASEQGWVTINTTMDLAVADYVELYVFQNSGGSLSIYGGSAPQQAWFNITYLGV